MTRQREGAPGILHAFAALLWCCCMIGCNPACIPHVSRMYPECIPAHSEQIMYPCILDTFEMHVSRRVLMSQILRGEIHVQLTTGHCTIHLAKNQDTLRKVSAGCDATWQIMRTSDRPASDRPVFPFFLVRRLRTLWILCVAFRKPARNSYVNAQNLSAFSRRFLSFFGKGRTSLCCRKQS